MSLFLLLYNLYEDDDDAHVFDYKLYCIYKKNEVSKKNLLIKKL